MIDAVFSLANAAGQTGRGVRIAVIDSGIHAAHPHVLGIDGGVAIDEDGTMDADVSDRLGHGTAVAAAIREKAPDASLLAVKVFDRRLQTTGRALVAAIRWAAEANVTLINLSLGTANQEHERELGEAVGAAARAGAIVVSAAPEPNNRWLPGGLPGVISVSADFTCPRDACRISIERGVLRLAASGYARPIPGVPPDRNLRGASLAVANATGLLAVVAEGAAPRSSRQLVDRMVALASANLQSD